MNKFSIRDALKNGWKKTKENIWFLVGLEILAIVATALAGDSVLGFVISALISFVVVSVILRISRNEKVNFGGVFDNFSLNTFGHFLVAKVLVGIFSIVGLALLVVPGIIIMIATSFTSYILVEKGLVTSWKNLTFWEAIKKSYRMTKGIKMRLFVFFLVAIGVNILGAIALGVGLLITIPTTLIAFASIYNGRKESFDSEVPASAQSNEPVSHPSLT